MAFFAMENRSLNHTGMCQNLPCHILGADHQLATYSSYSGVHWGTKVFAHSHIETTKKSLPAMGKDSQSHTCEPGCVLKRK